MQTTSEYYRDKYIFLTGSTGKINYLYLSEGFLGKVLLEKILRVIPQIKGIYLLIRGKKGANLLERFKKEVIGSQCFDRIKKQLGNQFDEYISNKIIPVEGDLLKANLGLKENDIQMLIDNVNIMINCAASVDFNAPLYEALDINYFGTLKVFELACQCKNLENFIHVSTAYVNSDKFGFCSLQYLSFIEEKVYEAEEDVEKRVADLMKNEVPTDKAIGNYPNTYTYTKWLSERVLKKRRPANMSMTIMRPTIVTVSKRDPMPGWVDNLIGGAAIYFYSGIGLVKYFKARGELIGDQIPVDFVVDHIIVAIAYQANKREFKVFHSSTSSRNPTTWEDARQSALFYWNQNKPSKSFSSCTLKFKTTMFSYKLSNQARKLPFHIYKQIGKILANENIKKNAALALKAIGKADMINRTFIHFNNHEWIFDSTNIMALLNYLTPEEQMIFQLDVTTIDWNYYLLIINYGLQKYILKENVDLPANVQDPFSLWDRNYFSDIQWAINQGKPFKTLVKKEHIIASEKVQTAIKQIHKDRSKQPNFNHSIEKEANQICDYIFATYNFKVIRMVAWFLNKVFKRIFEKVIVNESFLKELAQHNAKKHGPLIFIPTHKSYIDFLLASYVFYAFKMQCPHVGANEDLLEISIVQGILRSCGAFLSSTKQYEENILYKAIMQEYIQRLLQDECNMEFFVEGTRSRTGKIQQPKFWTLGIVIDTVLENRIPDATIIPLTINYETVMESESYPMELLGQEKVKESLIRILKATKILNSNMGRVYIEFGQPMSVREEMLMIPKELGFEPTKWTRRERERMLFTEQLGQKIMNQLIERLIIMPTSMVSAVLLMQRKGVSEDQLIKKTEWLADQIVQRGCKIGSINENSASIAVQNSLNHLQSILIKIKKGVFEVQISPNLEYKNILLLSYYRNQLIHIFFEEGVIACVLNSFGEQIAEKEGVAITRVWEDTEFLLGIFYKEYLPRNGIKNQDKFKSTMKQMIERNVLMYADAKQDSVKVQVQSGRQSMEFLCSLIAPLVESYWIVLIYIYSILLRHSIETTPRIIKHIQWFAESLYDSREIQYYESCSGETITNAIESYLYLNLISIDKKLNEKNQQMNESIKLIANEEKLLELESYMRKFMPGDFRTQMKSPFDMIKSNLNVLPFIAKL